MTIAKKIEEIMTKSSWIRKMFEEGARLKAEHGAENVFDFSLGNPNLPPPDKFNEILRERSIPAAWAITATCRKPATRRYAIVWPNT